MRDYSELFTLIKRRRARCLGTGEALDEYFDRHPDTDKAEARRVALQAFRAPFPSITGNPPVDRERPYNDLRFHGLDELIDREDMLS